MARKSKREMSFNQLSAADMLKDDCGPSFPDDLSQMQPCYKWRGSHQRTIAKVKDTSLVSRSVAAVALHGLVSSGGAACPGAPFIYPRGRGTPLSKSDGQLLDSYIELQSICKALMTIDPTVPHSIC